VLLTYLYCYQLFTTITVDQPAPGLKAILSFRVPDQRSGKVSFVICSFCVMKLYLIVTWKKRILHLIVAELSHLNFSYELENT
jgi:hypothetical protein